MVTATPRPAPPPRRPAVGPAQGLMTLLVVLDAVVWLYGPLAAMVSSSS